MSRASLITAGHLTLACLIYWPTCNKTYRAVRIGGGGMGGRAPPIICTNMPPPPKKKKKNKQKIYVCPPPPPQKKINYVCPPPPQSVIASYGPDLRRYKMVVGAVYPRSLISTFAFDCLVFPSSIITCNQPM